jgi:hypothetical protein
MRSLLFTENTKIGKRKNGMETAKATNLINVSHQNHHDFPG